ncbi:uncharacterized protein LOC131663900 [Phymastichus coffea]|uniref:uncharacterized protein LOC131663900 n=1 Tax=Phymastichus coffea TaxID=108790 RepID=UPI00273B6A92|nr:uncharacterized protein LOC131663900 [Phymastichus coffea]
MMKLWWILLLAGVALPMLVGATSDAESDMWEDDDDDKDTLVRQVRGTKGNNGNGNSQACRYNKGQWSECDHKTNMRTRTLTLKKGDKTCEQTKAISKKCKKDKACRYEKGQWSSCINQVITRVDNVKSTSDPSCDKTRRMTKKCKTENGGKKNNKDRSNKKGNKQQQQQQ